MAQWCGDEDSNERRLGTPFTCSSKQSFKRLINKLRRLLAAAEGWNTKINGVVDVLLPCTTVTDNLEITHCYPGRMYAASNGELVLDDVVAKYLEEKDAEGKEAYCQGL